jgi:hypothetical protein
MVPVQWFTGIILKTNFILYLHSFIPLIISNSDVNLVWVWYIVFLLFCLGCPSGSEAIKHSVCHRSRKSWGTAYLWLWVCQTAEGREWPSYDTMLYSKLCSTGSAKATRLWCSLRYLVPWHSPLHYAGRVSKLSCFHIHWSTHTEHHLLFCSIKMKSNNCKTLLMQFVWNQNAVLL